MGVVNSLLLGVFSRTAEQSEYSVCTFNVTVPRPCYEIGIGFSSLCLLKGILIAMFKEKSEN